MALQHCYKYYLALLNDDMTMIEHLILYIDTIKPNGRTVVIPGLEKTFESEDLLEAFLTAMRYIQDFFGCRDNDKTFITPAWQNETEYIQHNIPYEAGEMKLPEKEILDSHDQILKEFHEKLAKNQKKCDTDIAKVTNENFWDMLGDNNDSGN